ncbi:MAG: site-specific recombinase [Raineya sp.]
MQLNQVLDLIKKQHQEQVYTYSTLLELVKVLRPSNWNSTESSVGKFKNLIAHIQTDENLKTALKKTIEEICLKNNPLIVFTDVGIMSSKGFWSEAFEKLSYKFLPPLQREGELRTILNDVFTHQSDYKWVWAIPDELWLSFCTELALFDSEKQKKYWVNEVLNAIVVLAQRATALGLEPEIISKLPDMDDLSSPFLTLSMEIMQFVDKYKKESNYAFHNEEDYKHILVMIKQCENSVNRLHKDRQKYGVGLRITYFILRISQNIERLKAVLRLLKTSEKQAKLKIGIGLFKEIIFAENKKYNLSKHFSDNLGFLAYKVMEHTSKTGEHYITNNKQEYLKLFKYALGGGFIVAFLCIFKARIATLGLPPFGEALFYSLNYSIGFMLIHIFHFTLATKQPAMTASTIAEMLGSWKEEKPGSKNRDKGLMQTVPTIIRLVRSQFISLVGNVLMVLPVAYLLTWGYFLLFDEQVADNTKAIKLLADLSPWASPALFHAAIAGVYLMASGLIAGYYDNKVVYDNIPERLRRFSFFRKILPRKWFLSIIDYLEKNIGALAGNFYLGIFLGSTGTIGKILGINIDIRHVTFAGGNFAMSLQMQGNNVAASVILESLLGIFLIGLVNVVVSFGLSVVVALKSRNITFTETGKLIALLSKAFIKSPFSFILPLEIPKLAVEEKTNPPLSK